MDVLPCCLIMLFIGAIFYYLNHRAYLFEVTMSNLRITKAIRKNTQHSAIR